MTRSEEIDKLINIEYRQFSSVNNEGGRADCQDDFNTFAIMRRSQFESWNDALILSYMQDLIIAEEAGWNLVMEKYARMMESTACEKFLSFKDILPVRSHERLNKQEEIIDEMMSYYEILAQLYPRLVSTGRPLHTNEDTPFITSTETYLRGELSTYSDTTFFLYYEQFHNCPTLEESIPYKDLLAMVRQYGYSSLRDAEDRL